ncbi:MAG: AAA family ATPase [Eubacteriales bacterium]|nr:AAA family ATPase [Eubacteriales bacterium]
MEMGILVCGLNGAGKSTLGKALAKKLNYIFIDVEDLYFPKKDNTYIYASPRTREEVEKLLLFEIKANGNFVFASVKGDYGEIIYPFFQIIIMIDVPKHIRLQRVKNRSYKKFGNRMLPNGDLYEQEKQFFNFVESRSENTVEEWVKTINCFVIRVDGTKPTEENISYIIEQISSWSSACSLYINKEQPT